MGVNVITRSQAKETKKIPVVSSKQQSKKPEKEIPAATVEQKTEFKPKFFKYLDYVVIGDSLAIEIIKSNQWTSNFSECSQFSDVFCRPELTSVTYTHLTLPTIYSV